ncbi:MAG: hypothetical protein K2J73_04035 [Oscillospiraceae bacterium]|nr:hypothetical protein [Oscillospiraceae bacterium]
MKQMAYRISELVRDTLNGNIPFVTTYRFTSKQISMPNKKTPYIYFVADGSMQLHTPSGIMDCVAGQYSVFAIDTPFFGGSAYFF